MARDRLAAYRHHAGLGELSYRFGSRATVFEPSAGLAHVSLDTDGFATTE